MTNVPHAALLSRGAHTLSWFRGDHPGLPCLFGHPLRVFSAPSYCSGRSLLLLSLDVSPPPAPPLPAPGPIPHRGVRDRIPFLPRDRILVFRLLCCFGVLLGNPLLPEVLWARTGCSRGPAGLGSPPQAEDPDGLPLPLGGR